MTKVRGFINLFMLFLVIVLVFIIKYNYDEHFVDSNGNIGPLGAQLVPPTLDWYKNGSSRYNVDVGPSDYINLPLPDADVQVKNPYSDAGAGGPSISGPINQLPPLINPWNPNEAARLDQQPLIYKQQLFSRPPYLPSLGLKCDNGINNCEAAGTCVDGICQRNPSPNTVFNIPV